MYWSDGTQPSHCCSFTGKVRSSQNGIDDNPGRCESPRGARVAGETGAVMWWAGGWGFDGALFAEDVRMSQEMPATGGARSLTPQNDVDAGKDGSQLSGWQASEKFRQHRVVDCDNQ